MKGTMVSDISKIRVEDYFGTRGIDISEYNKEEFENLLYNTEILVSENDNKYISLAGMLFFSKNPSLWIKNSGVQLVSFEGNDVTTQIIDRKNIEGNLPDIIDKALDFVNLNNRTSERFEGIKRIDVFEYNKNVLREIIVNAFAHRDWSLIGAKIRVYVFKDFIEIRSPGKIPDTLTLERMKMGISYYRNPLIMQMLVDYGYADKIGRGIMSIVKYYEKNKLTPPEFIEEGFEFRVKILKE
ncbi:MAG: ATP-binding protein, partial [Clostridium sp.]